MDDRQLHRVKENRARRATEHKLGDLARAWAGDTLSRRAAGAQGLIDAMIAGGCTEVLEHAEPVALKRGLLTFETAEPGLAYQLRLQWEQRLVERLAGCGVRKVRFQARENMRQARNM